MNHSSSVFALGDGDNIRLRMEREILEDRLDACRAVSEAISGGMNLIREFVGSEAGWSVIFSGGDDILLEIHTNSYDPAILRRAMIAFEEITGSTISFGAASTLHDAYLNLRRAKSLGSGKLVCETELTNGLESEPAPRGSC